LFCFVLCCFVDSFHATSSQTQDYTDLIALKKDPTKKANLGISAYAEAEGIYHPDPDPITLTLT
jgi:hypothetical protein